MVQQLGRSTNDHHACPLSPLALLEMYTNRLTQNTEMHEMREVSEGAQHEPSTAWPMLRRIEHDLGALFRIKEQSSILVIV